MTVSARAARDRAVDESGANALSCSSPDDERADDMPRARMTQLVSTVGEALEALPVSVRPDLFQRLIEAVAYMRATGDASRVDRVVLQIHTAAVTDNSPWFQEFVANPHVIDWSDESEFV